MTNPQSRYESVIDQQIRMAQERGDFQDLPGMGKPLPGRGGQDGDLWWVKDFVRREGLSGDAFLPMSLRLAKEVERLPDTVRQLPSEQLVSKAVGELNERIDAHLRAPTGPHVPLRPVDPDQVVEQWRAAWQLPADHRPAPTAPGSTRRRRWFGRRRSA